jgi:cyclophilin family peptidyl-prolyl cis-trans isomerase/HEAT repeat protein
MHRGDDPGVAFRALVGRGLNAETMLFALRGESLPATQVLTGNGGGLDDEQRLAAIVEKLKASSPLVRYEAVRAYIRRGVKTLGCRPLVDAMNDPDSHVALQAIDALGDACKDDDDITKRLEGEVRVPPPIGPWHRETHVFVAAAKRSPERVAPVMNAFTTHVSFWVRMYAVRAVVAAGDIPQLERLAYDSDDNVREAALAPLLTLKKAKGDPVLIADLERNDVQLLRSAAILAKAAPAEDTLSSALVNAVLRLTRAAKETSRDGRLALLDALEVHGRPTDVLALKPLLRDFDPRVAGAAAALLTKLGGEIVKAEPVPVRRDRAQQFPNLSHQCVSVALSTGRAFRMQMAPAGAPIAVDRFLTLALVDHYYDGLSIHRVVPNFVIQAGSPGANEYSGHKEYMRDEIELPNVAGSVGLSIRGRNTGDAQFYVNLIDNARLDRGYTIFAQVFGEDMGVMQGIEEGVIMNKITPTRCQ